MELFDEDLMKNDKTDNKKVTTIILVVIIFLIIVILTLIGIMIYIKQTTLVVTLNGQESKAIKNMLKIDENNPQDVYVPIAEIAPYLGYQYYKGEYLTKSEEKNQCYVEGENEVAMFSLSSNIIYKTLKNGENDFDYFSINKEKSNAVKSFNDEKLYTTIDGIEKAFNVVWTYDVGTKRMNIYTMPALIKSYQTSVVGAGYTKISEDFTNQKAVLNGKLIVEKGENNDKKCAVLNSKTLKPELEDKYENIEYLVHTKGYLVTSGGKKGIISENTKTVVKMNYDDIKLMDFDKELYLVEKSNKYGVIDFSGKNILNTEYNQIGIDNKDFVENEIKSKYILADKLIPVKKDELWAFFDVTGKQVTDFKYDKIGYKSSNNKANSGYNLLVVPEYDVIVVGFKEKYTVMFTDGIEAWGLVCDSIYMSISEGQVSYLFEYDDKTYDVTETLNSIGKGKGSGNSGNNNSEENEEENEDQDDNDEEENNDNNENNNNDDEYNNNDQEENNDDDNYEENNNEENYEEEYNEYSEEYYEE